VVENGLILPPFATAATTLFNGTEVQTMKYLIATCVVVVLQGSLAAQKSINVELDAGVKALYSVFVETNQANEEVDGWRLQILATTDRQRLESALQRFKNDYSSIRVDWVHDKPYYKLRAGAFATRSEAERLKYVLSRDYSGLYPVKDKINERELL